MFTVTVNQLSISEQKVETQSQPLFAPCSLPGWLKTPCAVPALAQIHIVIAIDIGITTTVFQRNSFLSLWIGINMNGN